MEINKKSLISDAVGNLYRAAFYLAKGNTATGLNLLKKAENHLKTDKNTCFNKIQPLIKEGKKKLNSQKEQLYWAEKVLDCYCLLKQFYFPRCLPASLDECTIFIPSEG